MLVEVKGIRALVKMIRHSVNPHDQQIWSMALTYPRIVHSEFMTHRKFSRNASSSRAIPVQRVLEMVRREPAMPVRFGANQRGMQDAGNHDDPVSVPEHLRELFVRWSLQENRPAIIQHDPPGYVFATPENAWRFSAWLMADMSEAFNKAGYHKQVANRLTEFAQYITVIVTTTDLQNYFVLRDDDAADPTIRDLAVAMKEAAAQSIAPEVLQWGQWHLPYIVDDENLMRPGVVVPYSAARCARVSYLTHEGKKPTHAEDMDLHGRLLDASPEHMTPAEHPAMAVPGTFANFDGWCSYRWQREHHVRLIADNGGWESGKL